MYVQAEGVIPLDAYNNTEAVRDLSFDDDDNHLEYWQLILVVVAGAIFFCCIGSIIVRMCGKRKE